MNSVWNEGVESAGAYPSLSQDIETDTVVVGAGITGVSTALRLADAGRDVVLLEAAAVGASNTAGATGNLYGTVSGGLRRVRETWDEALTRQVVAWRMEALRSVEQTVARLSIDCAFARRPLYLGLAGDDAQQRASLEREFEVCAAAGLEPRWSERIPGFGDLAGRVLELPEQAQFNPYAYTVGVAAALAARGVRIYQHSPARDIDAGEGRVRTPHGAVRARHIVVATHSPLGIHLVQAEMQVYREYGVALQAPDGQPRERLPEGICWVADAGRSVRSYHHQGRDFLVVVGEKHENGHGDNQVDYHQRLRDFARDRFGLEASQYAWSAQQFHPADRLPYIGRGGHDNLFLATGFSADGLTWGVVAAGIIDDLVHGRRSEASERLDPGRFTPAKSAKAWLAENRTVTSHLVRGFLGSADARELEAVQPGQGRIIELDGRKHAVHRASDGRLSVLSAVCTHMGCHVHWNAHAGSWDCPCHGSRFDTQGRVLDGPAMSPLERDPDQG